MAADRGSNIGCGPFLGGVSIGRLMVPGTVAKNKGPKQLFTGKSSDSVYFPSSRNIDSAFQCPFLCWQLSESWLPSGVPHSTVESSARCSSMTSHPLTPWEDSYWYRYYCDWACYPLSLTPLRDDISSVNLTKHSKDPRLYHLIQCLKL